MTRLFKSNKSQEDLKNILSYILQQSGSKSITRKFAADLEVKLDQYARQPEMGTCVDERLPDLRCFTFRRYYNVYYREVPNGILLVRIMHGAQDILLSDLL